MTFTTEHTVNTSLGYSLEVTWMAILDARA